MLSQTVIAAAQAARRKWGVPVSFDVAQYGLESAWGTRMPEGSNNPFGIKALPGQPTVESWTVEYYSGVRHYLPQPFRKFDSIDEAFDAHARLLALTPRYRVAMIHSDDPRAFALGVAAGGYATAPGYGEAIIKIMDTLNLYRFDTAGPAPSAIPPGALEEGSILWAQTKLLHAGFNPQGLDGEWGDLTRDALEAFQKAVGIEVDGELGPKSIEALAKVP